MHFKSRYMKENAAEIDGLGLYDLAQAYNAKAHAVQTAVALMIERDPAFSTTKRAFKDLRTGIDCSKAEMLGLGTLLIAKGIITEREYSLALLDGIAAEVERYQQELADLGLPNVTLA